MQNKLIETVNEILPHLGIQKTKPPEADALFEEMPADEQMDLLLRNSGARKRTVQLHGEWYKDGAGPLLGETSQGLIALIPGVFGGYRYKDRRSGKSIRVSKKTAKAIDEFAYCFYPPLSASSAGKITLKDILRFMFQVTPKSLYSIYLLFLLLVIVTGLLRPWVYNIFFTLVIPGKNHLLLISTMALLFGVSFSLFLMAVCRDLLLSRCSSQISLKAEAAFMDRMLELPVSFFKKFNEGELADRVSSASQFCGIVFEYVISALVSALFSLIYISQILKYAPPLLFPSLFFIAVNLLIFLAAVCSCADILDRRYEKQAGLNGFVFELLSGIETIKCFGAEKRALGQWEKRYAALAKLYYRLPFIVTCYPALKMLTAAAAGIVNFVIASRSGLGAADFVSFMISFGILNGMLTSVTRSVEYLAGLKPLLKFLNPLMDQEREIQSMKEPVTALEGDIVLENISFRYTENGPPVLDHFSMRVGKGGYAAITGKTGSGKSTIFRLLLGFEKPQNGEILFDGRNINSIDVKSLRRNIGSVLQTSSLFQGTVFENIALNVPELTLEEAWEVCETAAIAEDIRALPMGMYTVVCEGASNFSGGQQQRLLIARALAPHPKILLLDEAVSALDNITQRKIEDALSRLRITRIIIAHRPSSVRNCDSITTLEGG
ncbi:MAG: ATP-binding cassette domain-containing protein [Treponema sp.]|nr:ATP-binding cassette domain-containing protein [Treponema sp.]